MRRVGPILIVLLAVSLSAQSGTVTVSGGSGNPGSVVSVTVTLALSAGTSIDSLSFGVRIIANGSAPAISGVTFTSGLPTSPTLTAVTSDGVGPFWASLSPTLTGTTTLGTVNFTIPATAVAGQTYSATLTAASATYINAAGNRTTLTPTLGAPSTVTVTAVASPAISLTGTSLSFSAQEGSNPSPQSQSVSISNSGGGTLSWSAAVATGTFLSVSPPSGTGSGTITITVNSASLAAGSYSGSVRVTATGASNTPQTINLSLTVSPVVQQQQPVLSLTGTSLTFTANQGGGNPPAQTVGINNSGTGTLAWSASVTSGSNFLTVSPASGTAPSTISISVNSASLAAGTYNGAVQVSASGANGSPQSVAVTLTVNAGPVLAVNTTALSFSGQTGAAISSQQVSISNSGSGTLSWSASAAVSSGASNWLIVSPLTGSATANPATLTVSVNPTGLSAGVYTGTVTVSPSGSGGSPQVIKVTLTLLSANATLALSPRVMQFSAAVGSNPQPQTLQIQNTGATALNFTVQPSTLTGGNWLAVSPASGSATAATPGNVLVQVTSAGLDPGNYTGTLNISANAGNSPQAVTVSLAVGAPLPNRNGIVNGASFSPAATVTPGAIVSLFGTSLAPSIAVADHLPLPTSLAGVQVLVNGVPAPLFYVSPTQINFQMPTPITDSSVQVVVVSGTVQSLPVTVPIVSEDPGIFTIRSDGTGQAAALNFDNSPNGSAIPAAAGSVVQLFCTGLGAVNPPVLPGQPAGTNPVSVTVTTPVVMVGGQPAVVQFSGLAPGFVGLYQVNVVVPQGLTAGTQTLLLQVNGRSSNQATIAIK